MSESVWHDIECGTYRADLGLWRELAAAGTPDDRPCELLELGCGTGRVSLALAREGCHVTALDLDPDLIAVLRERARGRKWPIDPVVGDACSFELARRFDVVLAPMQLVQLVSRRAGRRAMLQRIAAHLVRTGRAAFALLDLDESWEAAEGPAPLPDMAERDGWVWSSRPVAVRRRARTIELDRVRQAVSPSGELSESFSRVRLSLVSPAELEREAQGCGLVVQERRQIAPTDAHVASTVVILSRRG
jgi:SAM-dependent methyltransferase